MSAKSNAGIVQLVNKTFAKAFVDEVKTNPVTFVIGKFNAEGEETVTSDEAKQSLGGAVVGKTIQGEDSFALITERINWVSGSVYNAYDPARQNSNHYVLVTGPDNTQSVYLCIENGDAYQKGSISTIRPDGNFGEIISTEDGYKWLRLYNITGKFFKFLTASHIPVPTREDIDNAVSTSSLKLSNSTLNYWNSIKGRLLRFDIDPALKELRWNEKPSFALQQITSDNAIINFAFDFDSDNVVTSRRGYALRDVIIQKTGSGYTTSTNAVRLSADPDVGGTYNLEIDQIVGTEFIAGLGRFGPLIRPIFTLGNLDFPSLLNSDKGMIVASIDSSEIQKVTDVTSFDSVSLVKNLKHSSGDNIDKVVGTNTAFRMSDKVRLTSTTNLSVSDTLNSSQVTSKTRSTGNKIASVSGVFVELTRGDKQLVASDRVYKINYKTKSGTQSVQKTSARAAKASATKDPIVSINVLGFSGITDQGSTNAEISGLIGNDSSIVQSQVVEVENGEGQFGTDTIPLYTNNLGASDSITQSQGIVFRAIIGGDQIRQI